MQILRLFIVLHLEKDMYRDSVCAAQNQDKVLKYTYKHFVHIF